VEEFDGGLIFKDLYNPRFFGATIVFSYIFLDFGVDSFYPVDPSIFNEISFDLSTEQLYLSPLFSIFLTVDLYDDEAVFFYDYNHFHH